MPSYNPPLRDMQFLMHEVFKVTETYQQIPKYAEVDADTINAVVEEAGKFAANVAFPLNISGDEEGCTLNKETHEVTTPKGVQAGLCAVHRRRLACSVLRSGIWRPGPALRAQFGTV